MSKNVILISIDALRKDHMSVYGYFRETTPFLNSIKNNCFVFNNAYSVGPYTQASFPGILTSSFYFDFNDENKLSKYRLLISEALRKKGITTAAFHSNPYLSRYFGFDRGWNTFYDSFDSEVDELSPYEKAHDLNLKVMSWIKEVNDENKDRSDKVPFFCWIHYMDVHEPYIPEAKYISKINPDLASLSKQEMITLFKNTLLKRDLSDADKISALKDLYDAHIIEVDEQIRHLFEFLNDQNLLDDTIVIFVSDHGEEFGEHMGLSHDAKMYEELIKVPLLIYDSSLKNSVVSNEVVSTLDIAPTILDLFNLPIASKFQGRPLLPIHNYVSNGVFGEAKIKKSENKIYYFCDGVHKVIYNDSGEWELYNLINDPREVRNLINDHNNTIYFKNKLLSRINKNKSYDKLDELESRSIYIIREAYKHYGNVAMLWSIGKDSTTLLWLIRKAFYGNIPFPVMHIDTTYKFPEMYKFRDKYAKEWGLKLLVERNDEALEKGVGYDTHDAFTCCHELKTVALQKAIDKHKFKALFVGIRRDEHGIRSKERYFSPRDKTFKWDYKDQPPELWDQFKTSAGPDDHIRVHPLLHWTELDIWEYIRRENIPICELYFAKNNKRYRSLGCMPITKTIESDADDVDKIVEELKTTKIAERSGRSQDKEQAHTMQKLRALGYM